MGRVFAYCRVSTAEQVSANQVLEIRSAGFDLDEHRIITETVSGSVPARQRKEFARLLDRLERDDILVVSKLDRLGRSAMDVRSVVDALAAIGVRTHCLALGGVDLTSPAGRMTMGVIAAVAEFERDLVVERTQAGLKRAKATGKKLGRRASLSANQQTEVLAALGEGASLGSLAKRFDVSKSAIQRIAAKRLALAAAASASANVSPQFAS